MSLSTLVLPIVTGVSLVAAIACASPVQASTPADSTPCAAKMIIAHEGYHVAADADTVESQLAAWDIGATAADSDIWKTKDDYFVQMHDNDVSHSTDGTGLVTDMTLAEIMKLRTKRFHEKVPQLGESLALTEFNEPGRWLMFETKWSLQGNWALKKMDDEIKAAAMSDHVIIYSAYLNQVQYLSTIDPALTLWYKSGPRKPPPISDLTGLDGVMLGPGSLTIRNVAAYQAAGYTVIRGRVDFETKRVWQQFLAKGANGLMTDSPVGMINRCRALGQ